jgi:hypothetical protein
MKPCPAPCATCEAANELAEADVQRRFAPEWESGAFDSAAGTQMKWSPLVEKRRALWERYLAALNAYRYVRGKHASECAERR